jgi:hypothetical protein
LLNHFNQIEHINLWFIWQIVEILQFKQLVTYLSKWLIRVHKWLQLGKKLLVFKKIINISFSCFIFTMCAPNLEFQLVNPTTQVALFSICVGNCTTIQNITWNIYQGSMNSSSNVTKWSLINQTTSYQNIWFFGKNCSLINWRPYWLF